MDLNLHLQTIRKANLLFRVMNNQYALKIFELLNQKSPQSVNELQTQMQIGQSQVSQILSRLRKTRILNTNKIKKSVYYSINQTRADQILNNAKRIFE